MTMDPSEIGRRFAAELAGDPKLHPDDRATESRAKAYAALRLVDDRLVELALQRITVKEDHGWLQIRNLLAELVGYES